MTNPILQQLRSPSLNSMKQLVNMAKGNPQAVMNMLQTNPKYRQVLDIVNQYGDPKRAFYSIAQQKGIDPNEILDMLR